MAFDLKDYVPVHERLTAFWMKYPEGSIETSAEYPDERTVRVQATVYRQPGVLGATGHAEEIRVGHINKDSALENCETSAVGRALALMGFEIKRGLASREEMQKVQRRQEQDQAAETPAPVLSLSHEVLIDRIALLSDSESDKELKQATRLKLLSFGAQADTPNAAVGALSEEQAIQVLAWIEEKQEKVTNGQEAG